MVRVLGRANSINVQKVMWLGAEVGLDIDRIDIGGPFGGNDKPEYFAKNPTGKIPTLEDGELILWESHTIVRYIAEVYGSSPWWPAKIEDRYHANQWMDFYISTLHPHMTSMYYTLIRTAPEDRDPASLEKAVTEAGKAWAIVDGHLANNKFMTGTAPTMGDIPLACAAYRWHNLDISRPDLPHLKAWYETFAARLAFQQNVMLPMS